MVGWCFQRLPVLLVVPVSCRVVSGRVVMRMVIVFFGVGAVAGMGCWIDETLITRTFSNLFIVLSLGTARRRAVVMDDDVM